MAQIKPTEIIKMTLDWSVNLSYFSLPSVYIGWLELIDNCIRAGAKEIRIVINQKEDWQTITDCKGHGMNRREIEQEFCHWGKAGRERDITRYFGAGGKGALGAMAQHTKLWSTPETLEMTYILNLPNLQEKVLNGEVEFALDTEPPRFPFGTVCVQMSKLKLKTDVGILRKKIASTYASCLRDNRVRIWLNGRRVQAQELPIEPMLAKDIDRQTIYGLIKGKVGLKKEGGIIKGGIRCYQGTVGRLVVEHELFGLDERKDIDCGRMIGYVDNDFVAPTTNKDDFQRGTPQWEVFQKVMLEELGDIAELLKRDVRVPVEIEKAMKIIEREINEIFQDVEDEFLARGQKPPETKAVSEILLKLAKEKAIKRGEVRQPKPPSDSARGLRAFRKGRIRLHPDAHADKSVRSWCKTSETGIYDIYINTEFPALKATMLEGKRTRGTDVFIIQAAADEYYKREAISLDECFEKIVAVLARIKER